MTPSHFLAPRLLAGLGAAALVAGVGLFASSRPARTAGGPIPVTVSNPVLPTVAADGPTQQPFIANLAIQFTGNMVQSDTSAAIVPAGKRLVIQTVSLYRNGQGVSNDAVQAFVTTNVNGVDSTYPLPIVSSSLTRVAGTSQALTFQADGGTYIRAKALRTGLRYDEDDTLTVSGYLVDMSTVVVVP